MATRNEESDATVPPDGGQSKHFLSGENAKEDRVVGNSNGNNKDSDDNEQEDDARKRRISGAFEETRKENEEHPSEPDALARVDANHPTTTAATTSDEELIPDPNFNEIRALTRSFDEEDKIAKQAARSSSSGHPASPRRSPVAQATASTARMPCPFQTSAEQPSATTDDDAWKKTIRFFGSELSPTRTRKEFPHGKFHSAERDMEVPVGAFHSSSPDRTQMEVPVGAFHSSTNMYHEVVTEQEVPVNNGEDENQHPLIEAVLVSEEVSRESKSDSKLSLEDTRVDEEQAVTTIFPAIEARNVGLRDLLQHRSLQSLLCCIVVAAIVAVVVSTTTGDELTPIPFDGEPVSSFEEDRVWNLFPNSTLATIKEDRSSPQYAAYNWMIKDPNFANYSDWRIKQRFALATFFYATSGLEWSDGDSKWLGYNYNECVWYSNQESGPPQVDYSAEEIPCTDGIFSHLWLQQNNLNGELPLELYWLKSLESISLSFNSIRGTISSHIGLLTNLQDLVIQETKEIEGTLPTEIGLLTKLTHLDFAENRLSGSLPSELGLLTELTYLCLRDNQLDSSIPSSLGLLTELTKLRLSANNLIGSIPSELGTMSSLSKLELSTNHLTGQMPSELGLLTALTGLWTYQNKLSGTLFTELGNLVALSTELGCDENSITGRIPSELGRLTALQTLYLYMNKLSSSIPAEIFHQNMSLGAVQFSQNQLTGSIPSTLTLLSSTLTEVLLNNNNFSGSVASELAQLGLKGILMNFEMASNPLLTGTIPSELCDLGDGLVFDCLPQQLCGCECACIAPSSSTTTQNNVATSNFAVTNGSFEVIRAP